MNDIGEVGSLGYESLFNKLSTQNRLLGWKAGFDKSSLDWSSKPCCYMARSRNRQGRRDSS